MIWNQSEYSFIIRSQNDPFYYLIPAGSRSLIHFQDSSSHMSLQICKQDPDWQFSGRFSVREGDKMCVKTWNPETSQILVVSVNTLATDSFLLTSINTHNSSPSVIIRNYCPFSVVVSQLEDSTPVHEVPSFSSYDWITDEPLLGNDLRVKLPAWRCTAMGAESTEECVHVKTREEKKVHILTLVPRKKDCHEVSEVKVRVGRRECVRSARLGDHILLLYKRAGLGKRVRGKHSTVKLALPLRSVGIDYQRINAPPHLLTLLYQLIPLVHSVFTMVSFETALHHIDPDLSPIELIRQLSSLHLVLAHPSKHDHYIFNTHLLMLNRTVALDVHSVKIELVFGTPEIAMKWARLLRFEASTSPKEFPQNNWLGVSRTVNDLRNVESMVCFWYFNYSSFSVVT